MLLPFPAKAAPARHASFCYKTYNINIRTLTTNASIWTAAELGDVGRLRKVVTEKGRRPDSLDPHGYTPLHLAAQSKQCGMTMLL